MSNRRQELVADRMKIGEKKVAGRTFEMVPSPWLGPTANCLPRGPGSEQSENVALTRGRWVLERPVGAFLVRGMTCGLVCQTSGP